MFSQKKKNHTWIYLCGVLLILILAVFILVGAVISRNSEEEALQANLETRAEEKSQTQDSSAVSDQTPSDQSGEAQTDEDTESGDRQTDAEKDGQVEFYQSYYLVKYDKDGIRIYFSDETGRLTELEKTAIVYETLSEQDQIRFRDGIKIDTRDDLNRLIMDYES